MTGLEITSIDVIPIRIPNRVPIKLSTVLLEHQDNVIVRLRAGALAGIGETQPLRGFQGCVESHATIVPTIRDRIAPVVLGRDASAPGVLVRRIEEAVFGNPYAKAAVVDALYDLLARAGRSRSTSSWAGSSASGSRWCGQSASTTPERWGRRRAAPSTAASA